MNDLYMDVGWSSLNKYGEQLCGDHIEVVGQGTDDSLVFVLADGLGSGVKANILSTLTSKIISTMMAHSMSLEECVSTIASTLPVCQKRGIAYSTFTIIRVKDNKEAEIIQYDNPHVVLLRNGKNYEYEKIKIEIDGKTLYKSKLDLVINDTFVAMSDGAVYAGVGNSLNFGWQRENIVKYLEKTYQEDHSAKSISTLLLDVCNRLYGGMPGDDTTIGTVRVRPRRPVNLLIGPPSKPEDDSRMLSGFFSAMGRHIICGGTTSAIAADFLGKEVRTSLEYVDPEIPPIAKIEGVDLVTEGIITINRVLQYAQSYLKDNECYTEWSVKEDGASLVSKLLFEEATDIHFHVGKAVNPAHQNPDLPIHFNLKMRLIDELAECLKNMGKRIKVTFW
jgi:hypothetical protein